MKIEIAAHNDGIMSFKNGTVRRLQRQVWFRKVSLRIYLNSSLGRGGMQ